MVKIYTRGGDAGETRLYNGAAASKADPCIEVLGEVDELVCALGLARAEILAESLAESLDSGLGSRLTRLQAELYRLMAELGAGGKALDPALLLDAGAVAALEADIDAMELLLPPLRDFILPGEGRISAALHLARAICRRAERRIVALHAATAQRPLLLAYINRLSDLLFVAARLADQAAGRQDHRTKSEL